MAHFSRLGKVVVDMPEADHDRELAFWQSATGRAMPVLEDEPEYHGANLERPDLWLLIQRLGSGPARVHLDLHTDDLEAEVTRLEALGAARVEQVNDWWVMRDPAGLIFCVLPDTSGALNENTAQRWD